MQIVGEWIFVRVTRTRRLGKEKAVDPPSKPVAAKKRKTTIDQVHVLIPYSSWTILVFLVLVCFCVLVVLNFVSRECVYVFCFRNGRS
uniref:Transmembrane protein n=1 Tax=Helianthus annuus TaxID=4232 RepID=A0A251T827_HELAN